MKEYKVYDRAIQGIRRSESVKRAARYKEPEYCRTYPKGEKARIYLPILEWTNEDVAQFIKDRAIHCAPIYYDRGGQFHVERRLGCIGCPLAADNGKGDFVKYPKMLKRIVHSVKIYLDSHKDSKAYEYFDGNAYNLVFKRLFCTNTEEYVNLVSGGLFPEQAIDTKKFLEDYFGIEL